MEFRNPKLPQEAAMNLRRCSMSTVEPYALMVTPMYVFMPKNKKFVAVKAPLDFFIPAELERLSIFQFFYVNAFVDQTLPFYQAARSVKNLFKWVPRVRQGLEDHVEFKPAPYEISDAILRVVGFLWGRSVTLEPFFMTIFVEELCGRLPEEILIRARDSNMDLYECAIYRSSAAVFLALHLGYTDSDFLTWLRAEVFADTIEDSKVFYSAELDELVRFVKNTILDNKFKTFDTFIFKNTENRVAQKIFSRLERIKKDFVKKADPSPTIYGKEGFCDV